MTPPVHSSDRVIPARLARWLGYVPALADHAWRRFDPRPMAQPKNGSGVVLMDDAPGGNDSRPIFADGEREWNPPTLWARPMPLSPARVAAARAGLTVYRAGGGSAAEPGHRRPSEITDDEIVAAIRTVHACLQRARQRPNVTTFIADVNLEVGIVSERQTNKRLMSMRQSGRDMTTVDEILAVYRRRKADRQAGTLAGEVSAFLAAVDEADWLQGVRWVVRLDLVMHRMKIDEIGWHPKMRHLAGQPGMDKAVTAFRRWGLPKKWYRSLLSRPAK